MKILAMTLACVTSFVLFNPASSPGVIAPVGGATAQATVKAVLDRAMDVQTDPKIEGEKNRGERVRQVRQIIADNFSLDDMAKASLAENWKTMSSKQRDEFTKVFKGLFQDSYTRMVTNFLNREAIKFSGEAEEKGGVKVKTVIQRADESIPVDYILQHKAGKWLIHDVEVDGVSIVGNYRNTFTRVIRTESVDGLLKKMKLQQQAADPERS